MSALGLGCIKYYFKMKMLLSLSMETPYVVALLDFAGLPLLYSYKDQILLLYFLSGTDVALQEQKKI